MDVEQDDELLKEFDDLVDDDFSDALQKSQLQLYLDEPRINRNAPLDILQFWKSNQFRYPILVMMAHDILSIPVSTVASESAFSNGGRVLDQFRSSLKFETVEAIICTKDWLFGDEGDQDKALYKDMDEITQNVVDLSLNEDVQASN